jgi:hypothetical protein
MRELRSATLVAFVSGFHIGGDPGCYGFEPLEALEALFDFLQTGRLSDGTNRALLTIERPEYEQLFAVLRRFEGSQGKRGIYLPHTGVLGASFARLRSRQVFWEFSQVRCAELPTWHDKAS